MRFRFSIATTVLALWSAGAATRSAGARDWYVADWPPPTASIALADLAGDAVASPIIIEGDPCCDPGTVHGFLQAAGYVRPWTWQLLPDGLIYSSYLAGGKEPRFASVWSYQRDWGWVWDVTLGGRVGMVRYGTFDGDRPEGWQLDIEGAGFPRLDLEHEHDLISADFRFGVPLTYGRGNFSAKLAYYHLSAHLGDELIFREGLTSRFNFSRDVIVLGAAYWLSPDVRLYGEAGYGFYADEGTEPWEFQFGTEFTPAGPLGIRGAPFFAINGHLREESDFGGSLIVQTGWQWRGDGGAHLMRLGFQYFNGKSLQFAFPDEHEEQFGVGLWYDY